MNFNEWNEQIQKKGTEWGKHQLMVLSLAIENTKQVIKHYEELDKYDEKPWIHKA